MTKEKWKQKFSEALRAKVKAKGYKLTDVAARADLSYEGVKAYAHADRIPTAYAVNCLASVLDCSTDELINFDIYEE